jgi:hypothetical protein
MVRSEPVPIGTGMIAALDAVAKLNANAAPRAIVLIIKHPSFLMIAPPTGRFENRPAQS